MTAAAHDAPEVPRDLPQISGETVGHSGRYTVTGVFGEAIRRLRRRPATPVLIFIVTAVSIGVSTAILAVADPVLFRPLPFRNPSQLVVLPDVWVPADIPSRPGAPTPARFVTLDDVAQMPSVFSQTGAYIATPMSFRDSSQAAPVAVGIVTPGLIDMLGVHAAFGRTFDAAEGVPNGPAVAMVGYAFWRSQLGGRPVLDSTILLNGHPYTVVGILPASFAFPSASQVWIPFTVPVTAALNVHVRGPFIETVMARLADGVSLKHASQAVLLRWQQALADATKGAPRYSNLVVRMKAVQGSGAVVSLQSFIGGNTRPLVTFLLAGVGLIYLIVCANLTGVLLADGLRRRREFMVHEALGERRSRTVQRLFIESLAICGLGAIAGAAIAAVLLGAFRGLVPDGVAGMATATISVRVISAAIGGALVATLVITAASATQAVSFLAPELLRASPGASLHHGSRTTIRRGLVMLQVATATALLVGAMLLTKSLYRLSTAPLGIAPNSVGESWIRLAGANDASRYGQLSEVVDAVRHAPGIVQAGAASEMPMADNSSEYQVYAGGPANDSLSAKVTSISPGYVETLQIPVVAGRPFHPTDDANAPRVAIVNVAMIRKLNGAIAVGSTIKLQGDSGGYTVIGVVGNVSDDGPSHPTTPHVYLPLALGGSREVAIVARSTESQALMLSTMRSAITHVQLGQSSYGLQAVNESLRAVLRPTRVASLLSGAMALFAVIMSLIGVYGVITFDIDSRYREFGIRAALGASARKMIEAVGRGISIAIVAGLVLGTIAAYAITKVIGSLLVGVSTHDPATFTVALVSMLIASSCAVLIPGMRVLRLNPADILREE